MEQNQNTLSGTDNKKLTDENATNKENTAAWANMDEIDNDTNINFPSEYFIQKAKNWVDNGSQL